MSGSAGAGPNMSKCSTGYYITSHVLIPWLSLLGVHCRFTGRSACAPILLCSMEGECQVKQLQIKLVFPEDP